MLESRGWRRSRFNVGEWVQPERWSRSSDRLRLTDGRASCASHRFPKSRNGGKQARHSSKQRNRIEKVWMRFSMSCRLRAHTSTPWTQGEDDADALPGDA